jgi:hypothetical protein
MSIRPISFTAALIAAAVLFCDSAKDQQLFAFVNPPMQKQIAPPADEPAETKQQAPHFRRQIVNFPSAEASGTIIVDSPRTYLF